MVYIDSDKGEKTMLKIENYSKSYDSKRVVDQLSLEVRPGEIFGFIGHNGAGKSTTIKSIAGILDFDEGHIWIDGKDIQQDPIACKSIMAYIPDNPDLYEGLTGIRYLNFIADIFQIEAKKRDELIQKYADLFDLTGNLGDSIASYSHGMKQKLAIISALIHEPKLLLLDEPFVGLDPKASHLLKEIMREICDKGGCIFFSTHVLEVVERLCDHVAIIQQGKIVKEGKVEEVMGDQSLEEVFLELVDHA